jgi:hypothetical protein
MKKPHGNIGSPIGVRTILGIALVDAQTVTLNCSCRKGAYCPCATKAMTILCEAICYALTHKANEGAARPPARSGANPSR